MPDANIDVVRQNVERSENELLENQLTLRKMIQEEIFKISRQISRTKVSSDNNQLALKELCEKIEVMSKLYKEFDNLPWGARNKEWPQPQQDVAL